MGSARPLQCQHRPTSRTASLLGSSSGGPRQNLSACLHPLLRFHSPSEFDQLALPSAQLSPEPGRLPWDFCPFGVVSSWSPLSRVCLARYVPLPGFRNLLAAFSSSNLVGLFHPTDTRGILSSRAFSSTRAVTPRRCPLPSCRHLPCALGVLGSLRIAQRPASRPCSRGELVHGRSDVTPPGQPMLSWTSSSLGSAARGDGPAFTVPPLVLGSTRIPVKGAVPACTPECRSFAVVASSLSRVPSPSEVFRLL